MDNRYEKLIILPSLLLPWYYRNRRDLPWRNSDDPYAVWISEIMLQQTRVDTVIQKYIQFMKALPNIETLADCDMDSLLKLWEGLGYYSRARNLKKAASIIISEYGGVFPSDYDSLLSLPGIGKYTAGAILSIAFNQPFPAVDGNVLRVLSRYLPSEENISSDSVKEKFTSLLKPIYPSDCSSFTQALMELGALICLPNGAPLCENCPLKNSCHSGIIGDWELYPVKTKKAERSVRLLTVLLFKSPTGNFGLIRRHEKGLLKGMWSFPELSGTFGSESLKNEIMKTYGITPNRIIELPQNKHIFTHIEWKMSPFLVEIPYEIESMEWASIEDLDQKYALPTAHKKLIKKESV